MKKAHNIFISYNPDSEFEETLAIRLHTIGAVHGFQMLLPERNHRSSELSEQTKARISLSNYFIVFSTKNISKVVKQEIEFAYEKIKDKSKIIVILDKNNIKTPIKIENCTEIIIDSKNHSKESILEQILQQIKSGQAKFKGKKSTSKQDESEDALTGILLAGLALLLLGALFSNKK